MQQRLAALVLVGLAMAHGPAASAQKIDSATDQRIEVLEARVAELERRDAMHEEAMTRAPVAPPPAPVVDGSQPMPAPAAAPLPAPRPVAAPPRVADWNALRRGMTQGQITDLLGKPGNKRTLPLSSSGYYPDSEGNGVQFDRDGRVERWSMR